MNRPAEMHLLLSIILPAIEQANKIEEEKTPLRHILIDKQSKHKLNETQCGKTNMDAFLLLGRRKFMIIKLYGTHARRDIAVNVFRK